MFRFQNTFSYIILFYSQAIKELEALSVATKIGSLCGKRTRQQPFGWGPSAFSRCLHGCVAHFHIKTMFNILIVRKSFLIWNCNISLKCLPIKFKVVQQSINEMFILPSCLQNQYGRACELLC